MPGSPGRSSAKGRWRSGEVVGMAAIGGGVVEAEGELIDVAPVFLSTFEQEVACPPNKEKEKFTSPNDLVIEELNDVALPKPWVGTPGKRSRTNFQMSSRRGRPPKSKPNLFAGAPRSSPGGSATTVDRAERSSTFRHCIRAQGT